MPTLISCTKEKNIITFIARTDSGRNNTYTFDINQGKWTNTTCSRSLSTKPSFYNSPCSTRDVVMNALSPTNPILAYLIVNNPCSWHPIVYQTADKIDNIYRTAEHIDIAHRMSSGALHEIGENWDEYIKLLNKICPARDKFFDSLNALKQAQIQAPIEVEVDKYPWATAYQRQIVIDVISNALREKWNDKYDLARLAYWLFETSSSIAVASKSYVFDYLYIPSLFNQGVNDLIIYFRNIIKLAKQMNVKLEKKDILKQGSHLFVQAQLAEDEIINQRLKAQADRNREKLTFENDEFIIVIPTTQDEFQDEANQQNNCVRRLYMSKVADGRTNVVFIRRKDQPKHSCITCEVSNNGRIVQYLGCNNSTCLRPAEVQFEALYEAHLEQTFGRRSETLDIDNIEF